MRLVKVTGTGQVLTNLKKIGFKIGHGMEVGLKRAGLFLQRESQKVVPVDTGNLKNSAYTRNIGGAGYAADIVVGYTAKYAVYVHENKNARHKPGKIAKYLEKPARDKRKEILNIIKQEVL